VNINPLTNDQRAHCIARLGEGFTDRNRRTMEDALSDGALRTSYEIAFKQPVPSDAEIGGQQSGIREEAT
jgi:hypothetical protein